MNLSAPADGLFDTHVTWNDIELDMQRELGTAASFGLSKTAKNIGEGSGFMSRILLIDPDWQHKDKQLPEKFILKVVTQLAMQQLDDSLKNMKIDDHFNTAEFVAFMESHLKRFHNAEVAVYNHLLKLPEGKVPIPKICYMRKFSECNPVKGYILMEYLDNIKPIHIYENVSPELIKETLRAKAVMEAMSLKFTPEEKKEFTEKHFSVFFEQVFSKELFGAVPAMLRQFGMIEKADQMEKAVPDLIDLAWADQLADKIGMQRVLCHGDLWLMNILWRQKGDEMITAALIDYQNAHMGCPANDLVRLFSTCLSGKDRQQHWEELVEVFYGYLKDEIADMKMPYTLEQLKESYRRFLPMGAFMTLPMTGHIFGILGKIPNEEQRKDCLDAVMEKTVCLLDDILYYHERNMKLKKGEKPA